MNDVQSLLCELEEQRKEVKRLSEVIEIHRKDFGRIKVLIDSILDSGSYGTIDMKELQEIERIVHLD